MSVVVGLRAVRESASWPRDWFVLLEATAEVLRLRLEVLSGAETAVPLPGSAAQSVLLGHHGHPHWGLVRLRQRRDAHALKIE